MAAVQSASTRERLLAAAIDVFAEQGYEGARVQDIARTAGLTTGAIYANFRGKSDLLFDAIAPHTEHELDTMLSEARGRDVRAILALLGDRLLQPHDGPGLLIDAVAAARRDEQLASALRDRLAAREHAIAELVDGQTDVDADAFARFCLTLAMGALVLRTVQSTPPDGDAWHTLIARLLDAVFSEDES